MESTMMIIKEDPPLTMVVSKYSYTNVKIN